VKETLTKVEEQTEKFDLEKLHLIHTGVMEVWRVRGSFL
jgi:hypothetical protein